MGTYSRLPFTVCWFNLKLGGHYRRAIGTAWQVGFANIGRVIATYAFLAKDARYYEPGYKICIGFECLSAAACCLYAVILLVQNRSRDKAATDRG